MSEEVTAEVWWGFIVPEATPRKRAFHQRVKCEVAGYGCAFTGNGGACVRVADSVTIVGLGGAEWITATLHPLWGPALREFCEAEGIPWGDGPRWHVSVSRQ